MQTAHIARFDRFARFTSNIDALNVDPFNNDPSLSPCAHDSRAHDSQDFERDAFDTFSLSIDMLI
jgi:hypothetical protein